VAASHSAVPWPAWGAYRGLGGGDVFTFDAQIYQGSGGGPAWNNPDARSVRYRLYYEVDGQLFTDGTLHENEVQPDDVVWNA
jgi:hypothetical protein